MVFRRRGGRARRPKQPTFWERFIGTTLVLPAASNAVVVADPTFYQFGQLNEEWTIRRILLNLSYTYETTISVANSVPTLAVGVYKADPSITRDPFLGTADDTEADWLDLWRVQFPQSDVTAAAPLFKVPLSFYHRGQYRSIKSQRRLDTNEAIMLAFNFSFLASPPEAFGVVRVNWHQSNLLSRANKK